MGKRGDWQCIIVIDGDSASKLFAVGPNDLKGYFLPDRLDVAVEDVQRLVFVEDLSDEENAKRVSHMCETGDLISSGHKDNYNR